MPGTWMSLPATDAPWSPSPMSMPEREESCPLPVSAPDAEALSRARSSVSDMDWELPDERSVDAAMPPYFAVVAGASAGASSGEGHSSG